jgi:seryl-tRNA synthetase
MLDISFIRQNVSQVKKACLDKQLDSSLVDRLLEVDEKRRTLKQKVDSIRREVNENAEKIKQQVHQGGEPDSKLIKTGRQFKEQLKQVEPEFKQVSLKFESLMLKIPNVPAEEVPVGKDAASNKVVRQVGDKSQFNFTPLSHEKVMENLDWLDIQRAVKIAGFRSYFLKNEAVLLERAILRYALDFMIKQGFSPMTVPVLVNQEALIGTGYFPWGEEDHYKTQDDKYLTGTAEVALTAYYMGETLTEDDLPIKIVGTSPCFRREVGSYGKDTQGIIRVHQFNKVEQVVLTVADEKQSRLWHEKMLNYSEKLLQELGLAYQVVMMCTGDIGAGQRKKYDIETWFPAQKAYRETHSASYFNDFQTRRLGIKYQAKDGTSKFAYSLNNTVLATPRLLAAIVENYQKADGSVEIPQALQQYL